MSNALKIIDHTDHNVSPNDSTRKYRHVTILDNQIECMLVSDSTTDKSAACLDIHVGAMCDPPVAQGIAHFLEHMLFMGTKTYPDENAYQAFLASHGGSSNAYTDQENTVYYFDVLPDHFEGALDIFASFFVCPSFNESSTFREINAVDSENSKNLQSDMWRTWQLLKSMAKSSHPFSSFSTGNLKTLKDNTEENGLNIRDLLLEFYDKYYSANLMKLCVYGKEDLDTLQSWVVEKFSKVPNKNLPRPSVPSDPYGPEELSKLVQMIPIRDSKRLELGFPIPTIDNFYESKPEKYLSHLLGHESEGSILSALKAKGWANTIYSGVSQSYKDFALLGIDIDLSEEGSHHIDDIIDCVFSYIGMLKRDGIQEWIAQEIKDTYDLNYRFLQKTQPSDYVIKLANSMQSYKPTHVVSSPYIIQKIDISMIPDLLSYLTPSNLLTLYKNKSVKTSKKEKWYGTDYDDEKFSTELVNRWNQSLNAKSTTDSSWFDKLFLPKPNPFIPKDFQIRCEVENLQESNVVLLKKSCDGLIMDDSVYQSSIKDEKVSSTAAAESSDAKEENNDGEAEAEDEEEEESSAPQTSLDSSKPMQLFSGKSLQTWFKMDTTWKVPMLSVILILETGLTTSTPAGVALTDLLAQVLKESLNEYAYYADCAGLHYDIQLAKGGLEISFQGYQDKLPVLVSKSIEEMKNLVVSTNGNQSKGEMFFGRMKEKVLRSYYNSLFWQPYNHAIVGTAMCLEDPRWTNADKQRALTTVQFNDFKSFTLQFIQFLKIEALIHGNCSVLEATNLSNQIVESFQAYPLPSSMDPIRRVVAIESGTHFIYRQHAKHFNPDEVNSAIDVVYFVGEVGGASQVISQNSIHRESMLYFLVQMMADKAFDQLRTKEQLGYIVFTGMKKLGQYIGLQIVVQSNHKDPTYLDVRVEQFLQSFYKDLTESNAAYRDGKNGEEPSTETAISSYIDDKSLEEFKQATIEKLLEQPKNLDEETQVLVDEIRLNTYLFERKKLLADYLKQESVGNRAMIAGFLSEFVLNKNQRRKFSSHFYGGKCFYQAADPSNDEKVVYINDPATFKRTKTLLPVASFDAAFTAVL